jgi:hypothetical protein
VEDEQQQQQQQDKAHPWRLVWLLSHLGCFLLGWLLRGKCVMQQQLCGTGSGTGTGLAEAAGVEGGVTAGDAAAEGSGECHSKHSQVVAGCGSADTAMPATADKKQQQLQQQLCSTVAGDVRCFSAVDAPAGEQERQQQQDPATPSAGPAASAVAVDDDDKEATTSVSSNEGLSAAAAAAGEAPRSAPISKAAVRRRCMGRQAGLPHVLQLATKHHSSPARPSSRDQAGRSPASSVPDLQQQQQQQQFGMCQLHSRGSSQGGRSSTGGSSRGGGAVNLLQLQAVPAASAALLVQSGGPQQQMQVTFTAGPEVVHGVLIPAVR